jgi:ketosteroid isomerase-like protein
VFHRLKYRLPVAALLLASCRFRDLTPGGLRHDEAAVATAVTAFYQAIAAQDDTTLGRLTLPAMTALTAGPGGAAAVLPLRIALAVQQHRNESGGVRLVRSELHTDGDLATDRVIVVAHARGGPGELEAADLITLARSANGWRIVHVVFGSWRSRTAP